MQAPLKTDWEIAQVRTDRNEPTNQPRRHHPSATLKSLQETPSRFLISGTSYSSNETPHSCLSSLMACLCSKFSSHFGRLDLCALVSKLNQARAIGLSEKASYDSFPAVRLRRMCHMLGSPFSLLSCLALIYGRPYTHRTRTQSFSHTR